MGMKIPGLTHDTDGGVFGSSKAFSPGSFSVDRPARRVIPKQLVAFLSCGGA